MSHSFRLGLILAVITSFILASLVFTNSAVDAQSQKQPINRRKQIKKEIDSKGIKRGKDIARELRYPRFRPVGYSQKNIMEEELSRRTRIYEEKMGISSKTKDKRPAWQYSPTNFNKLSAANKKMALSKKHAWMLKPHVFKNLSSGGKRAALLRNGLTNSPNTKDSVSPNYFNQQLTNLGGNVPVNKPELDNILRTQSESSIAVRGNNVIVSFNDIAESRNTCGYSFSTDGGNTFEQRSIPEPIDQINLGDGVVAYGPNGELYYALLALKGSNFNSLVGVTKSTDNGATFQGLGDASNTLNNEVNFHDKEWIAVDNTNTATKGNVYASWTVFGATDTFIAVSTSTDGGQTFSSPINISGNINFGVQGSMPMVGPNGEVYVAFSAIEILGGAVISSVSLVKSIDGGKTFTLSKRIAETNMFPFFSVTGGDGVRCNGFPSVSVDKEGRVHIAYADSSRAAVEDRSDIYYIRSTDGGTTFSQPLKVNDDITGTTQINPSVAVAGDGTVAIRWWDRRNDTVNDSLTDVYMAFSKDNGASFGKNFRITDHNWVFSPTETSDYHGDYDGLVADESNFYMSWSDERRGDQDVYFTQIATNRDVNAPDFNISTVKTFDSVIAGSKVDYSLSTSAINGSSERLSLRAEPAIVGLTYSFNNNTINAGDSATLSVTTSNSLSPGTYFITVSAMGSNSVRRTNLRLTVYGSNRRATLPTNISNTRGNSFIASGVKVDSKNILHAVYEDDTEFATLGATQVFYRQSADGGKTYSEPLRLSTALDFLNTSPNLVVDAAGNIYVVWVGDIQILFTKSTDGGKTFSRPIGIGSESGFAFISAVAVDNKNNVMVSYVGFEFDNQSSRFGLFAARSSDGGTSFAQRVLVFEETDNKILLTSIPYLAFNSKGAVFIVYDTATFAPTSTRVEINLVSSKNGQKFKKAKVVSDSSLQSFEPHIAFSQNNVMYLSFYESARVGGAIRRDIQLLTSTNNGKTFTPKLNVSKSGRATAPYTAVDSQGNPTVVWQEFSGNIGSDIFLSSSNNRGQSFGAITNISGNSGSSLLPTATFDSRDMLFVGWNDDSSANSEIFISATPK